MDHGWVADLQAQSRESASSEAVSTDLLSRSDLFRAIPTDGDGEWVMSLRASVASAKPAIVVDATPAPPAPAPPAPPTPEQIRLRRAALERDVSAVVQEASDLLAKSTALRDVARQDLADRRLPG